MGLERINVTEFMGRQSKPLLACIGVALFAAAISIDKASPAAFETSIFYLVPVSFFATFLGRRSGLAVSVLSAVIAFTFHRTNLPPSESDLAYWNALAWLAVYVFFVYMISEIRALYAREQSQSRTDSLTGIPNRRSFFEHLETESLRARRYNRPISLAYIDLDSFKQVNDKFGHDTGDKLLTTVASVIIRDIRQIDVVARLGGDEFALLLPETDRLAAAEALFKVQHSLETAMEQRQWPVTFSVGLATFHPPLDSVHEMVNAADEAMYQAKKSGRGRLVFHGPAA